MWAGSSATRGSPAHAGMDPGTRRRRALRSGLPRSRGDGPSNTSVAIAHRLAPPLTRGWTPLAHRVAAALEGSPAHAGMDPPQQNTQDMISRLPRSRGDGPCAARPSRLSTSAPPLTRGWTPPGARRVPRAGGSPAHAGMDPRRHVDASREDGLPRSRGDGPLRAALADRSAWAPPLTRGWTPATVYHCRPSAGSPAHAGMDPLMRPSHRSCSGLPRSRGDGPTARTPPTGKSGAPPLTRGWTRPR